MIVIVLILIAVYVVVFTELRGSSSTKHPSLRLYLISILLSIGVYGYARYQSTRPPNVDYYGTGWTYLIRDLNALYSSTGNPYKIPEPGK